MSRRRFLAIAAGAGAAACDGHHPKAPPPRPAVVSYGRPFKIGCVAPFTGPRSYVGDRVTASLTAAAAHIDQDLGGAVGSYRPDVIISDAPGAAADGQAAYTHLKAAGVQAILWCGAAGLAESVPTIVRDLMPVIAVDTDLQSQRTVNASLPDLTTAAAAGFPVFQTAVPDDVAMDLLAEYLASDRHFANAFLIFSPADCPGADAAFAASCQRHGLDNLGTASFDSTASPLDLTTEVRAARVAGAQAVVVFSLPEGAAAVAAGLDQIGARYVDTPTAKSRFCPMLVGSPRGVGDPGFVGAAGTHESSGDLSVAAIGQLVALPSTPIRSWLSHFDPKYAVGGGEVGPADALGALLNAAGVAGSIGGADIVAALEAGQPSQFASLVPLTFSADRHLAPAAGDLVLTALERAGESRYVAAAGQQPLLDFTMQANTAAYPALVRGMLASSYGTSCTLARQAGSRAKVSACESVH